MLLGKYSAQRPLSPSHEHYLRAIWDVRSRRGYARMADVARELGVAPATLSVGLRPLEARGLIAHDEARFLLLTPAGERAAREVHHRFTVLRTFLHDVLGVEVATAESEACLIEHDISPSTTSRFVDFLKLLHEDPEVAGLLRERFEAYQRSCAPSEACSTCGLGCLVPAPK
ncbi:MAG: metal-dependent transcriptional regulator [Candidatus Eisenbacteria bacterium]|nr:metal-dependent transcriptional regulator [Candidatus Eisenbacteria bacterium]